MIKLAFCLRRRAGLSRQDFQRYWLEQHGPLVREHAGVLRIRRYVQLHTQDHPVNAALRESRGGPEAFDGIAELWWESLEELAGAMSTPEGRRAGALLLEDERRFIDLERSPLFVAREHELVAAERGDGGAA
jgi:uncharacterized protein (TIGR02118 family)